MKIKNITLGVVATVSAVAMSAGVSHAASEAVLWAYGDSAPLHLTGRPNLTAHAFFGTTWGGIDVTAVDGAGYQTVSTMVCNDNSPTQGQQKFGTNTTNGDILFSCAPFVTTRGVYGALR